MISAVFLQFADYRWIFWFTAIIGVPAATACLLLIPSQEDRAVDPAINDIQGRIAKLKKLDLLGVFVITSESL